MKAEENSPEKKVSETNKDKNSLKKSILEWLGMLIVGAVLLFFFAPESWWQFGVASENARRTTADFSLASIGADGAKSNEIWNFAEHRGRVVVVNYWATWCGPCRFETPGLVSVANEYKTRGVETVGVTMDENLAEVPPFIEKYKIEYPILLPGNDPNLSSEGMVLPTTFLYDKSGKLAKKYTGIVLESTLKSDIESLLNEQ